MFRFTREQVEELTELIGLNDHFVAPCGYAIEPGEAMCLFLRRLAYPNRLEDLEYVFGRSVPAISAITNSVLNLIHDRCARLLQFNAHNFGTETLTHFADAVKARGAPLACCVGFIDGTVRSICRPSKNQKYCYSGHKICMDVVLL
ncbi:TPA: hypothetical protein N0F65_005716 [Lagenidium giganteum]|uniref:DDE Tnp4 domain-containing protein n=1 Tax=Lagenidium giganteum TaxID=4803 RepID=A0AAV2ZBY8_9STRA|nr:TPA: hypothetical protein N0F65_005716 [Lagenidium giganteum]